MPRLLFILSILLLAGPAAAQDERFEKRVRPILKQHCQRCHGDAKPKAGFDVRTKDSILIGAKAGKVLVPGDPKRSLILQLVLPETSRAISFHPHCITATLHWPWVTSARLPRLASC